MFFIYIKGRVTEKKRHRESDFIYWLILPNATLAIAGAGPGAWSSIWVSHLDGQGLSTWAVIGCLPGCISMKLYQQQRSQDQFQHCGMGCNMRWGHARWHPLCCANNLPLGILTYEFFKLSLGLAEQFHSKPHCTGKHLAQHSRHNVGCS